MSREGEDDAVGRHQGQDLGRTGTLRQAAAEQCRRFDADGNDSGEATVLPRRLRATTMTRCPLMRRRPAPKKPARQGRRATAGRSRDRRG